MLEGPWSGRGKGDAVQVLIIYAGFREHYVHAGIEKNPNHWSIVVLVGCSKQSERRRRKEIN